MRRILAFLAALPLLVFAQENLVENSGFEEGTGPWQVPDTVL